jgi:hypothetical protein
LASKANKAFPPKICPQAMIFLANDIQESFDCSA